MERNAFQLLQLHTWNSTIEFLIPERPEYSPSKKISTTVILSSALGSAAAAAVIAAAVYFYFNSKYRQWKKDLDQLAKSMQLLPGVPTQFNFMDIKKATNNFHETKRLGQGGFGAVYRCRLPSPNNKGEVLEVAAKKFTRYNNRRYDDFLAEVSIINRLRHKNIVPLIGWSYNRGEPVLVYECMPNGSLDQHLFRSRSNQQQELPFIYRWETRYNIAKDIATGLQYVHHEYEPTILHRDIKASNILIDSTFQGRLGDFGLACVVADGKSSYSDLGIPGTIGFRAPEYIYNGKATVKTDIFAFGVLVLEIVTGNRAIGNHTQVGHVSDWVWKLHGEGKLLNAVDPALIDTEFNADEAIRLLLLGMACSNPNPWDRPSMVEVVQIISKSVPPPDVPLLKPTMSWPPEGWSSLTSQHSTSVSNMDSNGSMMIEVAGGRHASSENEGGRLIHYPRGQSSPESSFSIYQSARA